MGPLVEVSKGNGDATVALTDRACGFTAMEFVWACNGADLAGSTLHTPHDLLRRNRSVHDLCLPSEKELKGPHKCTLRTVNTRSLAITAAHSVDDLPCAEHTQYKTRVFAAATLERLFFKADPRQRSSGMSTLSRGSKQCEIPISLGKLDKAAVRPGRPQRQSASLCFTNTSCTSEQQDQLQILGFSNLKPRP